MSTSSSSENSEDNLVGQGRGEEDEGRQETSRKCTRSSPCLQPTCNSCSSIEDTNTNPIPPISCNNSPMYLPNSNAPTPPPSLHHPIFLLKSSLTDAIQNNYLHILRPLISKFNEMVILLPIEELNILSSSGINNTIQEAMKIIDQSNPPDPTPSHLIVPQATLKPPRIELPRWNGEIVSFYTWLGSCLGMFEKIPCDSCLKIQLLLQHMPVEKTTTLVDYPDYEEFKSELLLQHGSLIIYSRTVFQMVQNLPHCYSKSTFCKEIATKIRAIHTNLSRIKKFHPNSNVEEQVLSHHLISEIVERFPTYLCEVYDRDFAKFCISNPSSTPTHQFEFLVTFIKETEMQYSLSTTELPSLPRSQQLSSRTEIKSVRTDDDLKHSTQRKQPCPLCLQKKFTSNHYPLSRLCGTSKLGAPELQSLISELKLCSICIFRHHADEFCDSIGYKGRPKQCYKGCTLDGKPLHYAACQHSNHVPSTNVSKVSGSKSIPQIEQVTCNSVPLNLQYDTGCGFSLISWSTVSKLDPAFTRKGKPGSIRVFSYAADSGKVIPYTPISVLLGKKWVKLNAIDQELSKTEPFTATIPKKWVSRFNKLQVFHEGSIDILLGHDNLCCFPTELERNHAGLSLFKSVITNQLGIFGPLDPHLDPTMPSSQACIKRVTTSYDLSEQFLHLVSAENYIDPLLKQKLIIQKKENSIAEILRNTKVIEEKNKVQVTYQYKEDRLNSLGNNIHGAQRRISALHKRVFSKPHISTELDKYIFDQVQCGNYVEVDLEEVKESGKQYHAVAYNFVVSENSTSTKVRLVTDSSMKTETGLSLNDVTKDAPGQVPDMRGILMRARTHNFFTVFDIRKFFRSVSISEQDSLLRLVFVPAQTFSASPTLNTTWKVYKDTAIPFGDGPSGDYATCAKFATCMHYIHLIPEHIRENVRRAVIQDTYIDDGGAGADNKPMLEEVQIGIQTLLKMGGFEIKSWENSGDVGISKYLGVTWDRKPDLFFLKFKLNLSKRYRGETSGEDLSLTSISSEELPILKKNVLSVACQYYDPTGLGNPLVFTIRALYSSLCRNQALKMDSPLDPEDSKVFKSTVKEMIKAKSIPFPRQIIFGFSFSLHICFDGSLQGYGAAAYVSSNGCSNLLTSCSKILGKSSFSAPQSEICGAVLAVKMYLKIRDELAGSCKLKETKFFGDSEIILKMINLGKPTDLQAFYGTRIMFIMEETKKEQWFWCPGHANPADLLTRAGSTALNLQSDIWMKGGFLNENPNSWEIKSCSNLSSSSLSATVKVLKIAPLNPGQVYILGMLEKSKSYIKVKNALRLLTKWIRSHIILTRPVASWDTAESHISRTILQCFKPDNDRFLAKHPLKNLVKVLQEDVWLVADRSFRSRIGIPLVCKDSILATCIIKDAHQSLGHARDWIQVQSAIGLEFYIPGAKKLIDKERDSCAGCTRLTPQQFTAFESDVKDNLKKMNAPFTYCQADLFGPEYVYNEEGSEKRWVLVLMCLTCRAVHLEMLENYSASSINMALIRAFSTRSQPRVVWVDAGLNIIRAGKDVQASEEILIPNLNTKFAGVEFRTTLPKHHEAIGAVERVIGIIKKTISKSLAPPSKVRMSDEEFRTWLSKVMQKVNDRPLILGLPIGVTLTPNHVLHGFPGDFHGEEKLSFPVSQQLQRWRTALQVFGNLWCEEYARRNYHVIWAHQGKVPKINDLVLIRNEPRYAQPHTIARVVSLLTRPNGDIYGAKVEFRRQLQGRMIQVERHLHQLSPFMDMELENSSEIVHGLSSDDAQANNIGPLPLGHSDTLQDEILDEQ